MSGQYETRLAELGLALPEAAAPIASYVPVVEAGGLMHVSGQLPFDAGQVVVGRCNGDADVDEGQKAAKLCALMVVAQLQKALGSLDRVARIVKLGVFVNSGADFTAQPQVANGASDLMEAVFGDAGKHARAAVGVSALPRGAMVEVDAVVAVHPA